MGPEVIAQLSNFSLRERKQNELKVPVLRLRKKVYRHTRHNNLSNLIGNLSKNEQSPKTPVSALCDVTAGTDCSFK